MSDPGWTLLVLAAGRGSRFGGPKQLEPLGPHGEILSDYALRDAVRAGANRVVFVIAAEHEALFRAHHARYQPTVDIVYAEQRVDDLPEEAKVPPGRTKPWGTTHAVLAARRFIRSAFTIVNADDYYGPEALGSAGRFLTEGRNDGLTDGLHLASIAFPLTETLSPSGPVSRAILRSDAAHHLVTIEERHDVTDPSDDWVSMNCWACPAETISLFEPRFAEFLERQGDSTSAECALPETIGALVSRGLASVRVIRAGRGWLGVTHASDRDFVKERLKALP